jgi:hypothetical protein
MADQLQLRGGTTNEHSTFTGALREVTVDTDKDTLIVHDAATAGGHPLLREDGSNSALSLGTAGTPSLKFTGDTNTGIYSPGADQVAVATNGQGRLFIDASGNVGVGLTPASYAGYSVIGHGSTTGATLEQRVNGILVGSLTTDSQVTLKASTAIPIVFSTNNLERLRITSDGKVGIGTSSPSFPLHLVTSGNSGLAVYAGTLGANQIYLGNTAGESVVGTLSNQNFGIVTNGGQKVTVTTGGNVGIGTTSPGTTLAVAGGISGTAGINVSGSGWGVLPYVANSLVVDSTSGQTRLFATGTDASTHGNLSFFTGTTNGTASERARIDSSGRLLVGTVSTSSSALFQVQGNSSSSTGDAIIQLRRGENNASILNGESLGSIQFSNSESTVSAVIEAVADANWNTTNDYPSRLVFSTTADGASSPTERMRIGSDGRTICFSSGQGVTSVVSAAAGTTVQALVAGHSATSIGTGTVSFRVWSNGNVQNTNNSYGAISDVKLKENIVDANSQWDDLKALQVRNYNFKEGQTHTQIGLVAQEAELVSPGLVSESPDRDEDGNDLGTVTKSVNYSVLYMKAVKALQEAMERIETLEGMVAVNNITIDEQQHQLSTLAARLTALESA